MWQRVDFFQIFQSVWRILDGIGDAIDGTVEEISDFLYERLVLQGKTEVNMQEFVKICLMDKTLGDSVLKIFRAVISALFWSKLIVNFMSVFTCRHLELYIWALVLGNVFCPDQTPQGEILGQTQWNLVSNSFISLA